ncbi:hypothetical protein B0H14DRAFT_2628092 [Mycena olivaceomarginata]|nr:hypothetical protein B0H14DRAFT_2628092 [Mycena olivaceomarginata]
MQVQLLPIVAALLSHCRHVTELLQICTAARPFWCGFGLPLPTSRFQQHITFSPMAFDGPDASTAYFVTFLSVTRSPVFDVSSTQLVPSSQPNCWKSKNCLNFPFGQSSQTFGKDMAPSQRDMTENYTGTYHRQCRGLVPIRVWGSAQVGDPRGYQESSPTCHTAAKSQSPAAAKLPPTQYTVPPNCRSTSAKLPPTLPHTQMLNCRQFAANCR